MNTATTSHLNPERNVLVVDDEPGMRMALEMSFGQRGWQVETAAGKCDGLERFRQRRHPLVVSDVRMGDGSGFELLRGIRSLVPDTSVIMLTAFGAVPDAVVAIKSGACEYLTKPVAFDQLLELSQHLIARSRKYASRKAMDIVGFSPALLRAIEEGTRAAQSDADVLIEAESGTGKEVLARMIHERSARRERPFVAVNCAALPESLLESELFGHARGAFTGAVTTQAGKFELANGGTLLLDEIGEIPLALQPKLLRVLQEREFSRLGESRQIRMDVRVISTTNRKLAAMVETGDFRADLYYRLNVIPLSLPPLRERREDIRPLIMHFSEMYAGNNLATLPESLLAGLEQYSWPGNVRELANFVRRVMALGPELYPNIALPDHGTPASLSDLSVSRSAQGTTRANDPLHFSPGMSLATAERRLLEMTLAATCGNRSRAAEMLGISLRTVRNKIREYNLPPRREYARVTY